MIKTVYLSGPMRGYPEFNFPEFIKAGADLSTRGFLVYNPAERDLSRGFDPSRSVEEQSFDLQEAFRCDVNDVLASDLVVVLPGWDKSHGASLEVAIAQAIGTPVLTYPDLEPVEAKPKETILEEAQRIVYGKRQQDYGHPHSDFSRTAKIWSAILGVEVSPLHVSLCMIGLKMSRLINTPDHRDSIVDIAGYAGTYELVLEGDPRVLSA